MKPVIIATIKKELEAVQTELGIEWVTCGVGKVNAAMTTMEHIQAPYILAVGMAGSNTVPVGTVVVGTQYYQHDMDVTALGFVKGQIPFEKQSTWPASEMLLKSTRNQKNLRFEPISSGDQFMTKPIGVVDMESAAIAQVCFRYQVPFMAVRIISDDGDSTKFEQFNQLSKLAIVIHRIVRNLR